MRIPDRPQGRQNLFEALADLRRRSQWKSKISKNILDISIIITMESEIWIYILLYTETTDLGMEAAGPAGVSVHVDWFLAEATEATGQPQNN